MYVYVAGVKMQINLHHKLHQNAGKKKTKKEETVERWRKQTFSHHNQIKSSAN